jgi:hypothetical protein
MMGFPAVGAECDTDGMHGWLDVVFEDGMLVGVLVIIGTMSNSY